MNRADKRTMDRRKFVGNSVKLVALGSLLLPIAEACNSKKSSETGPTGPGPDKKKGSHSSSKKLRKKWNHESLVMNTKTKVVHFPTSKLYTYYDEIKPNHLQDISLAAWASAITEPVRLHKQQSGNIVEILTLRHLGQGVNDEYLNAATNTLSMAFSPACNNAKDVNLNMTNFRLHELMLQLVTLNTSIPATEKWIVFNSKIKKPEQLRKRQSWMARESNFNERVKYIFDRQNDYMNRLTERARKYSFI